MFIDPEDSYSVTALFGCYWRSSTVIEFFNRLLLLQLKFCCVSLQTCQKMKFWKN